MQFVRQLGLKAFIDFPNAIHTRYSHVLGVMHLSGKITDRLISLEKASGRADVFEILENNRNNLLAAALLHDIGHGPFSHVVDFILKEFCGLDHEAKSRTLIDKFVWMDPKGLNTNEIKKIIEGEQEYKFLNNIITGPLDCDKMDYLLRDSYHVGLRYSFDLNHFIGNFRILGDESADLKNFQLGLENDLTSIKTAEIFLIIWKNMYDLVYHIKNSRIAEKMIEKAIISRIDKDTDFINYFKDDDKYLELDDEKLLKILEDGKDDFSTKLSNQVKNNLLYKEIDFKQKLESFIPNKIDYANFVKSIDKKEDSFSDEMSKSVCSSLKCENYEIICDIIKSRKPKEINLNASSDDEPQELGARSEIIRAIKEEISLKIYSNKDRSTDEIKEAIKYFLDKYNHGEKIKN
jgi:HD superfamily phosphohydrolase